MAEDMLSYESSLRWDRDKMGTVTFPQEGKPEIVVATPPEFGGHEGIITPEDLFVAAANVCFMTTFLGTVANMGVNLISYESIATGTLEKVDKLRVFTKIILRPRVEAVESEEQILRMLEHAKKRCIAANSMKSEVIIEPTAISVKK
ncbi:MAG: OsmC family protein [ANME-2 cluster archaeon]|nr:OsmC family protein [ANME-2 cluster archaeon]